MKLHANVTIAFVGMTHLGLVSSTAAAAKGFNVLSVDEDDALIENLKNGIVDVLEPGLSGLIEENGDRQKFTSDLSKLQACNLVFIAPDIPTDDEGQSDLSRVQALIDRVIPILSSTTCLIILCQVPPGFTRRIDFDKDRLFYQVETLIFGHAVERAIRPERFIVGCALPQKTLPEPYEAMLNAYECPILPMQYESAELAKISINMCLVASISVANTMAEVCEKTGADWAEIVPALKLDRRIGEYSYLNPGLGIAGGNLERDLATVIRIGEEAGANTEVPAAWISHSRFCRDWAVRQIHLAGLETGKLAVWGLTYKENTHSTKNSPALATLKQLPDAELRVHDPAVSVAEVEDRSLTVTQAPLQAIDNADALLILTPWPEYRNIDPNDIAVRMAGRLILDPYWVLSQTECREAYLEWRALGYGSAGISRELDRC